MQTGLSNRGIREEDMAPIVKENELGELETFRQAGGAWVHSTEANVIFQERKILVEYDKLAEMKELRDAYKKRIEETLKNKK